MLWFRPRQSTRSAWTSAGVRPPFSADSFSALSILLESSSTAFPTASAMSSKVVGQALAGTTTESAFFAEATRLAKPFGSSTAISASIFRFTSEPALFSPAISFE